MTKKKLRLRKRSLAVLDKETIDLNEKNIGGIRGYGEDD